MYRENSMAENLNKADNKPFQKPGQSQKKILCSAPKYHHLPLFCGGLKHLIDEIKHGRNTEKRSVFTDDSGSFNPHGSVPLLAKRYRYLKILGRGVSAVVIKARDTFRHNHQVAIKVMNLSFTLQGYQEVNCIRRLNQSDPGGISGAIRLLNTFELSGHFCMVYELLNPTSLHLYFRKLSPEEKLPLIRKIAIQLLKTLGFLQSQDVIHADIKPENILCAEGKVDGKIKLIDFGNAIHCIYDELSLYYEDYELQTIVYRAPEVMCGLPFGPEIDLWSVGCVLAELYIGRPLFCALQKDEVLEQVHKLLGPFPVQIYQRGKFYQSFQHLGGSQQSYIESYNKLWATLGDVRCGDFVSFLLGLLSYDAGKRMTIQQAIQHPFLTSEVGIGFTFQPGQGLNPYRGISLQSSDYTFTPHISSDLKNKKLDSLQLLHRGTGSSKKGGKVVAQVMPFSTREVAKEAKDEAGRAVQRVQDVGDISGGSRVTTDGGSGHEESMNDSSAVSRREHSFDQAVTHQIIGGQNDTHEEGSLDHSPAGRHVGLRRDHSTVVVANDQTSEEQGIDVLSSPEDAQNEIREHLSDGGDPLPNQESNLPSSSSKHTLSDNLSIGHHTTHMAGDDKVSSDFHGPFKQPSTLNIRDKRKGITSKWRRAGCKYPVKCQSGSLDQKDRDATTRRQQGQHVESLKGTHGINRSHGDMSVPPSIRHYHAPKQTGLNSKGNTDSRVPLLGLTGCNKEETNNGESSEDRDIRTEGEIAGDGNDSSRAYWACSGVAKVRTPSKRKVMQEFEMEKIVDSGRAYWASSGVAKVKTPSKRKVVQDFRIKKTDSSRHDGKERADIAGRGHIPAFGELINPGSARISKRKSPKSAKTEAMPPFKIKEKDPSRHEDDGDTTGRGHIPANEELCSQSSPGESKRKSQRIAKGEHEQSLTPMEDNANMEGDGSPSTKVGNRELEKRDYVSLRKYGLPSCSKVFTASPITEEEDVKGQDQGQVHRRMRHCSGRSETKFASTDSANKKSNDSAVSTSNSQRDALNTSDLTVSVKKRLAFEVYGEMEEAELKHSPRDWSKPSSARQLDFGKDNKDIERKTVAKSSRRLSKANIRDHKRPKAMVDDLLFEGEPLDKLPRLCVLNVNPAMSGTVEEGIKELNIGTDKGSGSATKHKRVDTKGQKASLTKTPVHRRKSLPDGIMQQEPSRRKRKTAIQEAIPFYANDQPGNGKAKRAAAVIAEEMMDNQQNSGLELGNTAWTKEAMESKKVKKGRKQNPKRTRKINAGELRIGGGNLEKGTSQKSKNNQGRKSKSHWGEISHKEGTERLADRCKQQAASGGSGHVSVKGDIAELDNPMNGAGEIEVDNEGKGKTGEQIRKKSQRRMVAKKKPLQRSKQNKNLEVNIGVSENVVVNDVSYTEYYEDGKGIADDNKEELDNVDWMRHWDQQEETARVRLSKGRKNVDSDRKDSAYDKQDVTESSHLRSSKGCTKPTYKDNRKYVIRTRNQSPGNSEQGTGKGATRRGSSTVSTPIDPDGRTIHDIVDSTETISSGTHSGGKRMAYEEEEEEDDDDPHNGLKRMAYDYYDDDTHNVLKRMAYYDNDDDEQEKEMQHVRQDSQIASQTLSKRWQSMRIVDLEECSGKSGQVAEDGSTRSVDGVERVTDNLRNRGKYTGGNMTTNQGEDMIGVNLARSGGQAGRPADKSNKDGESGRSWKRSPQRDIKNNKSSQRSPEISEVNGGMRRIKGKDQQSEDVMLISPGKDLFTWGKWSGLMKKKEDGAIEEPKSDSPVEDDATSGIGMPSVDSEEENVTRTSEVVFI